MLRRSPCCTVIWGCVLHIAVWQHACALKRMGMSPPSPWSTLSCSACGSTGLDRPTATVNVLVTHNGNSTPLVPHLSHTKLWDSAAAWLVSRPAARSCMCARGLEGHATGEWIIDAQGPQQCR